MNGLQEQQILKDAQNVNHVIGIDRETKKEKWKPVKGHEEFYEVSNLGNVRSFVRKKWGGKVFYDLPSRILKPAKNTKGYLFVSLKKNGNQKIERIHRIVLNSFIGESKLQCNHKNGIKTDNRLENLEWVTNQENRDHAMANNLHVKGSKCKNSKLTEDQVKKIKLKSKEKNIKRGYWSKLALDLGVSHETISSIIHGRNWKHIKI